jgi:hypothetical protein
MSQARIAGAAGVSGAAPRAGDLDGRGGDRSLVAARPSLRIAARRCRRVSPLPHQRLSRCSSVPARAVSLCIPSRERTLGL